MMGEYQPDMFGGCATPAELVYPDRPGFKGTAETGREAAEAIAPKLGPLQKLVRELVEARGATGLIPEEACDLTGKDRVTLQPRFSELKAKGLIVDSGRRRTNPSSRKRAVVWVSPQFAPSPEGSAANG